MRAPDDKYAELTALCASHAAEALALMLGASAASAARRAWTLQDGRLPRELFAAGERVTAVLAQLEGKADGLAGLILRRDLLEWILRRLIGDGDVKTLSERALSALVGTDDRSLELTPGVRLELPQRPPALAPCRAQSQPK